MNDSFPELDHYLADNGWEVVKAHTLAPRDGEFVSPSTLELHQTATKYLEQFDRGIYRHQHQALQLARGGNNVCLATATASGKSLVFYAAALDLLARTGRGNVLAVYPLKALGTEQEQRWRDAVARSGENFDVARIDGSVSKDQRLGILAAARIVIMTPDVIHAWMLSNLSNPAVSRFLSNIKLIVLDEAHTYSGVFGSNASYLYRRINHAVSKLSGALPQYIAASATMKSPKNHLTALTGLTFEILDESTNTSERGGSRILMVNPPTGSDTMTSLTQMMAFIAGSEDQQFITFVDSRKQTEHLAAMMARATPDADNIDIDIDTLEEIQVLPYRSGYEEADRRRIQERLSQRQVRGVVSTSALEMGIDIPHLTTAILVGVPHSATSFFQRIGRVGRNRTGTVLLVNNGSVRTTNIFRHPDELMNMPLAESALYLDNGRIQYIHALCLARAGGEDEALSQDNSAIELGTAVSFPESFLQMCANERLGEISPEYQAMKGQAGEEPNYAFPLRDCDVSFDVVLQRGPNRANRGSLSYAQVLREAYPGAVYYYQTQPLRVFRVNTRGKSVEVRRSRRYTTKPTRLPTLIFPNYAKGNVYEAVRYGSLGIVESNLQIRESIAGFNERRGPTQHTVSYPLNPGEDLFFELKRFSRNYFTSGVVLNHPSLNTLGARVATLAQILYEAYLIVVPFERQDISVGEDKHRANRDYFSVRDGDRFICVYDQSYGSLRLTSRLLDEGVLRPLLETTLDIAEHDDSFDVDAATIDAIRQMIGDLGLTRVAISSQSETAPSITDRAERIILPDSVGLNIHRDNEEFFVEGIFYSPQGLKYRGRNHSQTTPKFETAVISAPVAWIIEIPGESKMGYYDYETGEIQPDDEAS